MDRKDSAHQHRDVHPVRITARGDTAAVEVDGKPVEPGVISAYSVSQLPGEPAHVVLHLTDDEDVRFAGLARVSVADAPHTGPAAASFLEAIDAEELERAALARVDLGTGPHSLTQAMLTQLGEWARGD